MEFDASKIALAAVFVIGGRLAIAYLGRLDKRGATSPAAERAAIAASRRRAHGHLWLLGSLLAGLLALIFMLGPDRLSAAARIGLFLVSATTAWLCGRRAARVYGDARRLNAEPR